MEELVQLDLDQVNKLLGVEAGRQLHTFVNHSLLTQAGKKDSGRWDGAGVPDKDIAPVPERALTEHSANGQVESLESMQPIELEDESSD